MIPILLSVLNDDEQLYASFKSEAEPHMNALYNFAVSLTNDRDGAQDLVQETYIKAFRFFDKFEKGTNCKAWLFRIMKNTFINDYRKITKQPKQVDFDNIDNFYEEIKASFVSNNHLEEEIFNNLLGDEITDAIADLSDEFKTDKIDVVVLNDKLDPLLKYEIISKRKILYEEQPYRVKVEPLILSQYFDFYTFLDKKSI